MTPRAIVRSIAIALALSGLGTPSYAAGTTAGNFSVNISLNVPGAPPPPGVSPAPSSGDVCVSQALSQATGAMVRVVCRSGHFVSIEPPQGAPFLGVHGGAFRYYFANAVPEHLRYLGGDEPWVGPGTVTSIRISYPEGLDGYVEMQVGF